MRTPISIVAALLALLIMGAAPASASHQKGGFLSTAVTADGHLTGTLVYMESGSCTTGDPAYALSLTVNAPSGAQHTVDVDTTYSRCLPNTATLRGTFDVDMNAVFGAQLTGNYVVTFSSCCRISGIRNATGSGTQFTSKVRSIPGQATSAPTLDSNVATGIGIGYEYRQNLNASDPDGGALTYTSQAGQPSGPSTDIVTYGATGDVVIPASTTSTMSNGWNWVYKVRVVDSQGDYSERDVLLTATNSNQPPVLTGVPEGGEVVVEPGMTTTVNLGATDPNAGNVVTIGASSLPSYVTFSQTSGNPATATLTIAPPANTPNQVVGVNLDATDNATATLTSSANLQVRIGVAPDTTLDSSHSGTISDRTPTFAFSSNMSSGTTYQCRIDSGTWQTCTSPFTTGSLADGQHTVAVRAVNGQIPDATPATSTFTVDATGPQPPQIDTHPDLIDNASGFTFTAAEAGGTLQCQFDTGAWAACSEPQAPLSDGQHVFRVRQIDAVGNVGQSAEFLWTLDTHAPLAPEITAAPATLTNDAQVTFSFAGEPQVGHFECRLDDSQWATCASPAPSGLLGDGEHTFEVRQVDDAGNAGAGATVTFAVDATPPAAPELDAAFETAQPTSDVEIAFTGEDGGSYECRVDGGGWAACPNPFTAEGLADGEHEVDVRQLDLAGNVGDVLTVAFAVDTHAPDAPALTAGPPQDSDSDDATIEFDGEDGGRYECRTDEGEWADCTSPATLTNLADGEHRHDVRQVDAAGNVGDVATTTFTVDTVAPEAPTSEQPLPEVVDTGDLDIVFGGEPGGAFQCMLDEDDHWSTCTSPFEAEGLADGPHMFKVRQVDAAGNVGAISTTAFTVDTVAPMAPVLDSNPDGQTNASTVTFAFSGEETGRYECRLDDGEWATCESPHELADLDDGEHTFEVRQVDAAGNVGETTEYPFTVDTEGPLAPKVVSAPAEAATSATVAFEADGATECRVDGGAWVSCASPYTPAGLGDGEHVVEIRASDALGNRSLVSTVRFVLDTTAPAKPVVTSGPLGATKDSSPAFTFTGEPGGSFECRTDAGTWVPCTSPYATGKLAKGRHVVEIRQIDRAGNVGPAIAQTIDVGEEADGVARDVALDMAQSATVDGKRLTVGCRLDSGSLRSCRVRVYALVNDHHGGASRRMLIGTGRVSVASPDGRRKGVRIALNQQGRRLLRQRLGGLPVVLDTRAVAFERADVMRARARGRLFPERQFLVPQDGVFAVDSATLSATGERFVRHLRSRLTSVAGITCVGHTDAAGSAAYNERLGRERAQAVCEALRQGRGLRGARTEVRSAGETQPRATNATARGRALNRRVEITVRYR